MLSKDKMRKIKKQEEMRRMHVMIDRERQLKSEQDILLEKQEKIEMEHAFDVIKLTEEQKKKESLKKKEIDLRIKEQQFKYKTHRIIDEQEQRIENKR